MQARVSRLLFCLGIVGMAGVSTTQAQYGAAEPSGILGGTMIIVEEKSHSTGNRSWGPEQVIGPPNTPQAGDYTTAWASQTPDGRDEWLELKYAEGVRGVAVMVYESYNPGALRKVEVRDADCGQWETVFDGSDPTPQGSSGIGVSVVPLGKCEQSGNLRLVDAVRVHLASTEVSGWNEIDAVGLVDQSGTTHWAVEAKASSTYGVSPEAEIELPRTCTVMTCQSRIEQLEQTLTELQARVAKLEKMSRQRPTAKRRPLSANPK